MNTGYAVRKAIKAGQLVRPVNCPKCCRRDGILHSHHSNYCKPIDVDFLCGRCHRELHKFLAWFYDRLEWIEFCKENGTDPKSGLAFLKNKMTGENLKTTLFEKWKVSTQRERDAARHSRYGGRDYVLAP